MTVPSLWLVQGCYSYMYLVVRMLTCWTAAVEVLGLIPINYLKMGNPTFYRNFKASAMTIFSAISFIDMRCSLMILTEWNHLLSMEVRFHNVWPQEERKYKNRNKAKHDTRGNWELSIVNEIFRDKHGYNMMLFTNVWHIYCLYSLQCNYLSPTMWYHM